MLKWGVAVKGISRVSADSGTPDAVELTYGNFLWSAVGSGFNIGVEPSDHWLCCLPLSHISGLSIVMR